MIHGQAYTAGVVKRAKRLQYDNENILMGCKTKNDDWILIFLVCVYTVAINNNTVPYNLAQDEIYDRIKHECSIHDDSLIMRKVQGLTCIIIRRAIEDISVDIPKLYEILKNATQRRRSCCNNSCNFLCCS